MARPDLDLDQDAVDPQDQAETADETHLNEDADEFTTLEEAPNTFDDTAADDDDEDLAPLDESEFDDADADYEDNDDTDANDELDDTPDERTTSSRPPSRRRAGTTRSTAWTWFATPIQSRATTRRPPSSSPPGRAMRRRPSLATTIKGRGRPGQTDAATLMALCKPAPSP
jgi:hypothetical protein